MNTKNVTKMEIKLSNIQSFSSNLMIDGSGMFRTQQSLIDH